MIRAARMVGLGSVAEANANGDAAWQHPTQNLAIQPAIFVSAIRAQLSRRASRWGSLQKVRT